MTWCPVLKFQGLPASNSKIFETNLYKLCHTTCSGAPIG
uniref:Uncharacterized protein n=1 Tax=Nelumbo nucifera TaxID=4432 RepID=A0A822Y8J5_NELNU|nr:TPA_asm: hypothetical protein HUJ06_029359 [Nelumbo nucifera]